MFGEGNFTCKDYYFVDAPKPPTPPQFNIFPEEGKPLQVKCEFDANPEVTKVTYYKQDSETKEFEKITNSHKVSFVTCFI